MLRNRILRIRFGRQPNKPSRSDEVADFLPRCCPGVRSAGPRPARARGRFAALRKDPFCRSSSPNRSLSLYASHTLALVLAVGSTTTHPRKTRPQTTRPQTTRPQNLIIAKTRPKTTQPQTTRPQNLIIAKTRPQTTRPKTTGP